MRSQRACFLHPHGDHFVDICFETVAPVFKILKRSNGSFSLSNVYQILLEMNCIDVLPGSFSLKKIIYFIFKDSISFFPYLYEILKFPFKDASSKFDFFFQIYVGWKMLDATAWRQQPKV